MRQRIRKAVVHVAKTNSNGLLNLPFLELSLLPLFSLASVVYRAASFMQRTLYQYHLFTPIRLPVPVVSVGNITWGGNGKTPMVEFLSGCFLQADICPLILTRGYAGGDEARLLRSHLEGFGAVIGVGPDRAMIGMSLFKERGVTQISERERLAQLINLSRKQQLPKALPKSDRTIGVVIIDDGMQHRRLRRDLEIVMVNLITRWGNMMMVPRGPLRESLDGMKRADVVVLHHADLVAQEIIDNVRISLQVVLKPGAVVVLSRMTPKYFSKPLASDLGERFTHDMADNFQSQVPLAVVRGSVVLCASGVGCPESLSLVLEQMGPIYVERIDYVDHHLFQDKDVSKISSKFLELRRRFFGQKSFLVLTEKDYFRNTAVWKQVDNSFELLVLHSSLEILSEGSDLKVLEEALSILVSARL